MSAVTSLTAPANGTGTAPGSAPEGVRSDVDSPAGSPVARLHIADGAGSVTEVTVSSPLALIGRAQDVQVKLDSGMVSRHHAELTRDPAGRWVVRDMHSRNGTMVNGVAITSRPLEPGDRIGVGPYTLTFLLS